MTLNLFHFNIAKAAYAKDGKIFNEIFKGEKTRIAFYHEILDVLSALGGDRPC